MFSDIILYISLLAAFFWLNSFGFYVWKTFKYVLMFLKRQIRQSNYNINTKPYIRLVEAYSDNLELNFSYVFLKTLIKYT